MESIYSWPTDMRATEILPHRRRTLVALRWALIAVCASLILFSDHMAGRLGFAALLLLAVILGRYRSRGYARVPGVDTPFPASAELPAQPRAAEAQVRRKEVGQ